MVVSESQIRASKKWRDAHARQIIVTLNTDKDADILAAFDAAPSRIDYIRRVVREDIAKSKAESRKSKVEA